MTTDAADWNVAILDGSPEAVVNLPAVAAMVKASPLGIAEAMRRLRAARTPEDLRSFSPDQLAQIRTIAEGNR